LHDWGGVMSHVVSGASSSISGLTLGHDRLHSNHNRKD